MIILHRIIYNKLYNTILILSLQEIISNEGFKNFTIEKNTTRYGTIRLTSDNIKRNVLFFNEKDLKSKLKYKLWQDRIILNRLDDNNNIIDWPNQK